MDEEKSIDSLVPPEKSELNDSSISKNSAGKLDALSNGSSSDAHHLRTSIGAYDAAGDSSTRNSTEKSNSNRSSQKVLPRYLRASTGSCHDFCKYGKKHSSEEKERRPFRKRIAKSLPNEQYHVQIIVSGEKKTENVVNHKPTKDIENRSSDLRLSLDAKSYSSKPKSSLDRDKVVNHKPSAYTKMHSPDVKPSADTKSYSPKTKKFLDEEKVVKHKPSTDTKNHSPDLKPSPETKSYSLKTKTSLDEEKVVKRKPSTGTKNRSPNLPSDLKSYSRKPKMSLVAKSPPSQNASSSKKSLLPNNKPSSAKKLPSPEPPEIVKSVVFFPSENVKDPAKEGSSTDDKISTAEKKATYLSKHRSSPVKSKTVMVSKSSSSSDNSDGIRGKGRRNETGRNKTAASKASAKKVVSPPTATLSPRLSVKIASIKSRRAGNLKLVSPLKDRNRIRRGKSKTSSLEKVSKKTLHVIETKTENKNAHESFPDNHSISSFPSPSSAKSLSHAKSPSLASHEEENKETTVYSVDEADEFTLDDESLEIDKAPPVQENHNKTLRKSRGMVSRDKNSSPVKLKFRSGKVVDVQSDNSSSPRRLRFRRARASGTEDGKGDLRRIAFKRAGVNDGGPTVAERSSEKVILKHQDVQDKKDAQGLLNNVIEETASKLAESRKSKVKALVGAFETVISLQEINPSSQAVS